MPDPDDFAGMIGHVDGYLCALKDAQIRGGLHVLGQPPAGEALVDTVLAITRLPQGAVPVAAGHGRRRARRRPRDRRTRPTIDRSRTRAGRRVEALAAAGWDPAAAGGDPTLRWVADRRWCPNLRRTSDEIANLLAGLDGRHVPAGPSGAPTRGGAHVLPTGRNFYSVDPKAIPSPLAWDVGGPWPTGWSSATWPRPARTPAPSAWSCGARPPCAPRATTSPRPSPCSACGPAGTTSRRVEGVEVMPLAELGRPRVDVTVRISGFFRDAFPDVVALLDDAVAPGRRRSTSRRTTTRSRAVPALADARVFGPAPGTYGSGIYQAIEGRSWRTRADLAEVYLAWSATPTGAASTAWPRPSRCAAGSPPSRWR